MKNIDKVQEIIDLIEEKLSEELSVKLLAEYSGMSIWQFQRIFRSMVGQTMGDYLRRRRLSVAAEELLNSDKKILDIALNYQFNSQEAFSRPFKTMFGQTPAKFREQKPEVVLEKRLVITPEMLEHLNGGIQLVPNIITLPARLFAGQETEYQNHIVPGSDYNKTLTPFWRQFIKRIPSIPNRKGKHAVGVARSQSQKFEENRATYLACIEVETLEGLADDLIPYQIPETQYAVFTNKGTGEKTFYTANYIYGTWLPLSDYLRADGDDLEYFDHRYHLSNRDSLSDYYLPIVKNS